MSSLARIPLRIAQVSDLHFGGALSLPAEAMDGLAERRERDRAGHRRDRGRPDHGRATSGSTSRRRAGSSGSRPRRSVIPGNHDARNVGYLHFRRLFGDPYSPLRAAFDPRAGRAAAGDRLHDRRPRLVRAGRERGPGRPRPLRVAPRAVRRARRHPDRHRPPPPRPDPGHRPRAEHRPRRRRPPAHARRPRRRRRARRPQARAVLLGPERDAASATPAPRGRAACAPARRRPGTSCTSTPPRSRSSSHYLDGRRELSVDLQPQDPDADARGVLHDARAIRRVEPGPGVV